MLPNRLHLDRLVEEFNALSASELGALFDDIGRESPAYLDIMTFKGDAANDRTFQRMFNGFYRVRQRPQQWYVDFYSLFQRCRATRGRKRLTISEILEELRNRTGKWEYSFSTKLLHSIDPQMAIMDSRVLILIDLPQPQGKHRELEAFVRHYADLCGSLAYLIQRLPWLLEAFDKRLPQLRSLTLTKKMDFILWRYQPPARVESRAERIP